MRIHSNRISRLDFEDATRRIPDVKVVSITEHGSRSHKQAFEVQLAGFGPLHRRSNRAGTGKAADYEEWGAFLGQLYLLDPAMKAGPYVNADDFGYKTGERFSPENLGYRLALVVNA